MLLEELELELQLLRKKIGNKFNCLILQFASLWKGLEFASSTFCCYLIMGFGYKSREIRE